MKQQVRLYTHGVLFVIGLVLMVGGIVADKPGAGVVGLIVAAVNYWQWRLVRRQGSGIHG